jgi:uncharacterized protein YndB with AHSA1/START domain
MAKKTDPGMSDEAVRKATGRTWPQWCAVLNKAGARAWDHKTIARYLHERRGVAGWWAQMVTVGYERLVQGRRAHQKGRHYEVSVSKTIAAPVGDLFEAWQDPAARARWIGNGDVHVRKATRNRSMRITWDASRGERATSLGVNFYARGKGKSLVQVNHGKLPTQAAAARAKRAWGARLAALQAALER